MKVVLGIRFSSWNPAFQLEKRIPGQSLLKGGRDEGCLGDPLFELEFLPLYFCACSGFISVSSDIFISVSSDTLSAQSDHDSARCDKSSSLTSDLNLKLRSSIFTPAQRPW